MHHHVPLTLEAMRGTVIGRGLLDADAMDRTLSEVHAHLVEPQSLTLSFTMLQILGRVPG